MVLVFRLAAKSKVSDTAYANLDTQALEYSVLLEHLDNEIHGLLDIGEHKNS